jgi:hypothetical protein
MNRVVVKYNDNALFLLGARNRLTGKEYKIIGEYNNNECSTCFADLGIPAPKHFVFKSINEASAYINQFMPQDMEGLVVMDYNQLAPTDNNSFYEGFNRIKVKTVAYLAAARVKSTIGSPRSVMELILSEKADDVKVLLPEHIVKSIDTLSEGLTKLYRFYDELYPELIKDKPTRKDLAMRVQAGSYNMGFIMERYSGKVDSFKNWVKNHGLTKEGIVAYPDSFLDKLVEMISNV